MCNILCLAYVTCVGLTNCEDKLSCKTFQSTISTEYLFAGMHGPTNKPGQTENLPDSKLMPEYLKVRYFDIKFAESNQIEFM